MDCGRVRTGASATPGAFQGGSGRRTAARPTVKIDWRINSAGRRVGQIAQIAERRNSHDGRRTPPIGRLPNAAFGGCGLPTGAEYRLARGDTYGCDRSAPSEIVAGGAAEQLRTRVTGWRPVRFDKQLQVQCGAPRGAVFLGGE
jgi:hypothetical protein